MFEFFCFCFEAVLEGVRECTGPTSVSLRYQLMAIGLAQQLHYTSPIQVDFEQVSSFQGVILSLSIFVLDSACYSRTSQLTEGKDVPLSLMLFPNKDYIG